ncbi:hypothetical protein VIN01S_25900 [Vibrio inusitatus NBRC 102082]|uniref:Lipoprotein n=1 Tax=Vibrio inusitatus NBRC 102082 TaxID=1219070 RepID=A0A4Y3HXD8_9VIBR|nr:hypothetical protein [Vibrio inusitatus]GEA51786.1 hypothetical protein VIN01S_25900 [Vibrio inusitatus NBRC 102082]
MKHTLLVLALTPIILTGCGGSSSTNHEVQKVLKQTKEHPVSIEMKELGQPNIDSNNPDSQSKSAMIYTLDKAATKNPQRTIESSIDNQSEIQSSKNAEVKQDSTELNKWLVRDENQLIISEFENAGFNEEQVFNICKLKMTEDATFACAMEPDTKDTNTTSAVFKMYYRSMFTIDNDTSAYVNLTYTPSKQMLVLSKTITSSDPLVMQQTESINTAILDTIVSPDVKIQHLDDTTEKRVQVTVSLKMDGDMAKKLKDMYLNSDDSKAITELKLTNQKGFRIDFTNGMAKSEQHGDDLALFNYRIRQIIGVAAS